MMTDQAVFRDLELRNLTSLTELSKIRKQMDYIGDHVKSVIAYDPADEDNSEGKGANDTWTGKAGKLYDQFDQIKAGPLGKAFSHTRHLMEHERHLSEQAFQRITANVDSNNVDRLHKMGVVTSYIKQMDNRYAHALAVLSEQMDAVDGELNITRTKTVRMPSIIELSVEDSDLTWFRICVDRTLMYSERLTFFFFNTRWSKYQQMAKEWQPMGYYHANKPNGNSVQHEIHDMLPLRNLVHVFFVNRPGMAAVPLGTTLEEYLQLPNITDTIIAHREFPVSLEVRDNLLNIEHKSEHFVVPDLSASKFFNTMTNLLSSATMLAIAAGGAALAPEIGGLLGAGGVAVSAGTVESLKTGLSGGLKALGDFLASDRVQKSNISENLTEEAISFIPRNFVTHDLEVTKTDETLTFSRAAVGTDFSDAAGDFKSSEIGYTQALNEIKDPEQTTFSTPSIHHRTMGGSFAGETIKMCFDGHTTVGHVSNQDSLAYKYLAGNPILQAKMTVGGSLPAPDGSTGVFVNGRLWASRVNSSAAWSYIDRDGGGLPVDEGVFTLGQRFVGHSSAPFPTNITDRFRATVIPKRYPVGW
jgi:hypothetical protein